MAEKEPVTMENVELNADAINKVIADEAAKQGIDPKTLQEPQRDEFGRFVSPKEQVAKKEPEEDIIYKDKFIVGGREVEFEDPTVDGLLRQVKAAQAAHAAATAKPEEKKTEIPAFTDAERFELGIQIAAGKTDALESYLTKSGIVERILAAKGVDVAQLKENVEASISAKKVASWDTATKEFIDQTPDWPGGTNNLKVMQYKIFELGLAEKPSAESLQQAYESMKQDGMVYEAEVQTQTHTQQPITQAPPAPKKKMTSSTLLGTSQEPQVRRSTPVTTAGEAKLKSIIEDPNADPREIMRIYNEEMAAQGQAKRG